MFFRAKRGEIFLKFTNEEDINKEETIILRENTISLRAKRGENFEIFDCNINYKNDYDKYNYNYNSYNYNHNYNYKGKIKIGGGSAREVLNFSTKPDK